MAQLTSGVRSVLSVPAVYAGLQRSISRPEGRRILPDRYINVDASTRLLDIGCANGRFLEQLPDHQYVGFDPSDAYITAAREEFGDRGTFLVGTTDTLSPEDVGTFDIAVARGVLHHLDDDEVRSLAAFAASVLDDGGSFVTLDPCRITGQRTIARMLVDRDRGQNVRHPDEYLALVRETFEGAEVHVHHRLLRVPYDHAVIVATARR